MKKKLTILVLCAIMMLTGCQEKEPAVAGTETQASAAEITKEDASETSTESPAENEPDSESRRQEVEAYRDKLKEILGKYIECNNIISEALLSDEYEEPDMSFIATKAEEIKKAAQSGAAVLDEYKDVVPPANYEELHSVMISSLEEEKAVLEANEFIANAATANNSEDFELGFYYYSETMDASTFVQKLADLLKAIKTELGE